MSLTYAIADLHGRFDLLTAAFDAIVKHAAERSFKIITLGDYVDRGPQSRQIIDHLMAAQEMGVSLICLKGNHEDMMVETLRKPLHPNWWIDNGGGQTLISYGHERSGNYTPEVVPEDHIVWLENLPLMHIDAHRIFVHAGVDRFKPLDQQDSQVLLWKLYDGNDEGGHDRRHVVHGHHQFEDGPIKHPGRTDLDTFAWYTGRLAVGVFNDEMAGGPIDCIEVIGARASLGGEAMAKTSIVDEIEHHPQFCLDLSDPLGAIRMGNSIGRFGDRHPAPALGFNARDRYFHFRRTFDEGLHAFVENAFESRVRYRYSCHGRTRISGYRITGPLAAVLPSFVESVAGSRDLKRSAQIEFFLEGFWLFAVLGFGS